MKKRWMVWPVLALTAAMLVTACGQKAREAVVTLAPSAEEETEEEETLDLKEELSGLDVNLLTPMQALALISEWKEKLK